MSLPTEFTSGFTSSMLSQYQGYSFIPYEGVYVSVPTEMLFTAASLPQWKDPYWQPLILKALILLGNPGSYFK